MNRNDMKRKAIKYFIISILSFSIALNVYLLYPHIEKKIGKTPDSFLENTDSTKYMEIDTPDSLYIQQVVLGCMNMPDNAFRCQNDNIINDWYNSYNWIGLSYYVMYYNDSKALCYLEKLANSFLTEENDINYEIKSISQYPIGILFLNLYKITNKHKYLEASHRLYNQLVSLCNEQKRIDYIFINDTNCYVDVLGMIVPFLIEYSEVTKKREAYEIAIQNISIFKEYGTDLVTGIPCHEYDPITKIKLGISNWGRGIGWYLLALAYCPEIEDKKLIESINKMDYKQYPLSKKSKYDTSVHLLFEIFKQSRCSDRTPDLSEIKSHTTTDGFIRGSSSDSPYGNEETIAPFCNGFLLMLMTRFSNLEKGA